MPRLKQVPRTEASASVLRYYDMFFGERDPVAEPGTNTGTPGNWWTTYALAPHILDHAAAHFAMSGGAVWGGEPVGKLEPRLRELGILRAAYTTGSRFVFSQHCKAGRRYGLTDAQVAAVPHWSVSDAFSALERALLAYADNLTLEKGRTPDGVMDALRQHLDDAVILEFSYHVCAYMNHATIARALRLELDDTPEHVTEATAPS